jgi:hypothetical protein
MEKRHVPKMAGGKKPQSKKQVVNEKKKSNKMTTKQFKKNFTVTRGGKAVNLKKVDVGSAKEAAGHDQITKYDPSNSHTTRTLNNNNILPNVNRTIPLFVQLPQSSLIGVCIGIVSSAMQRGLYGEAQEPFDPYTAFNYLLGILSSYAANSIPQVEAVPRWLSIIGQALINKKIKSKGGFIDYAFDITAFSGSVSWLQAMGPSSVNKNWNVGVSSGTTVNNNFTIFVAPPAYNPLNGPGSFLEMCEFLANGTIGTPMQDMFKMVPPGEQNIMTDDISAYAVSGANPGSGFGGQGGFVTLITNEVPISAPIFSQFALPTGQLTTQASRSSMFSRAGAGDSIFLGSALVNLLTPDSLKFKRPAAFHCVDFLEFLDVIAQWVSQLQQKACSDPQFDLVASGNGTLTNQALICPITLQELGIILRAYMMNVFADSQPGVQSIYPYVPGEQIDPAFVPFVCGAGTCAVPLGCTPLFPLPFVENIKSLSMRTNYGTRGAKKNPAMFLPILGQYNVDSLAAAQYVYNPPQGEPMPSFTVVPSGGFYNTLKNAKGEPNTSETIISYIDGSASGNVYVGINDPGAIQILVGYWNGWITTYMATYSDPLQSLSTDGGVPGLQLASQTAYWTVTGSTAKTRMLDSRYKATFVQNQYAGRSVVARSFFEPPLAAPFTEIFAQQIVPIMELDFTANPYQNTEFLKMATALGEMNTVVQLQGTPSASLATLHTNYAQNMTHARNGAVSELAKFYSQQNTNGTGGILSSIAQIGVPTILGGLQGLMSAF